VIRVPRRFARWDQLFAGGALAPVALAAAVFYALSPAFLGYADAIANQPIDDLHRFGLILAVVLTTLALHPRLRQAALLAAWVLEFLLSLFSFDSVFFPDCVAFGRCANRFGEELHRDRAQVRSDLNRIAGSGAHPLVRRRAPGLGSRASQRHVASALGFCHVG